MLELSGVDMAFGSGSSAEDEAGGHQGTGRLTITSKRLMWQEEEGGAGKTYEVEVPMITLHAISKDPESFPKPCLYCQVGGWVDGAWPCFVLCTHAFYTTQVSEGGEEEEEEEVGEAKEVCFVPQDPESRKCIVCCLSPSLYPAGSDASSLSSPLPTLSPPLPLPNQSRLSLPSISPTHHSIPKQKNKTVASLFEALSKAALMNPDPPEAGENEGDDELIFDQAAFAAMGGEQVKEEKRK